MRLGDTQAARSDATAAWSFTLLSLVAALFPLGYLILAATVDSAETLRWIAIWFNGTLVAQAWQTAWVCGTAAAVALAASAPQAVAVTLYRFRGARIVECAAMAPMLFAPYAAAGAWAGLDLGDWSRGALAMAVQIGFSCAPWCYVAMRVALTRLPPSLGEAAAAAGMSRGRRVLAVWIPLLLAPALAAAMFSAARAFGDYGTAERNGAHTFGVAFHDMWSGAQSPHIAAAVALLALVPAITIAWIAATVVTRRPPRQFAGMAGVASLQKMRMPRGVCAGVVTWTLGCLALSVLIPEWQYVDWALDGRSLGWSKSWHAVQAALSSSGAVAVTLALLGCIGALLLRPGARAGRPEQLLWFLGINLFVPPMALALAWLGVTADGAWLATLMGTRRDGTLPMLLAQATKLAPFALLPVLDRVSRENESLREALGATGMGQLRRIGHILRMALPAIAVGTALAFMEAVKELEIALTLQPFGYQSTAIKIHSLARFHSEYSIASWVLVSQALILPALAIVVWWLARLDRAGSSR